MGLLDGLEKLTGFIIDGAQAITDQVDKYRDIYNRYYEWASEKDDQYVLQWLEEKEKVASPTMRETMEITALKDVLTERGYDVEKKQITI